MAKFVFIDPKIQIKGGLGKFGKFVTNKLFESIRSDKIGKIS